jgi:hypothetical protein
MADWYISSAAYALIPTYTVKSYAVGDIVRPTAPAATAQFAFRCTTAGAGSTEPAWPAGNNATITTGAAVFTNVSGQSTYGWSAAAGNCLSMGIGGTTRGAIGDRVFLSSDHAETSAVSNVGFLNTAGYGLVQMISINRAGSVPPGAADVLAGASITYNGGSAMQLDNPTNFFFQGITFNLGGTATQIILGQSFYKSLYFKSCAIVLSTSTTTAIVTFASAIKVVFDGSTIQFNNANQRITAAGVPTEIIWLNAPSAVLGTAPTQLFVMSGQGGSASYVFRGVDFSAVTGTLITGYSAGGGIAKVLFDSCRIASAGTRYTTSGGTNANATDDVELVNCFNGSAFLSERHTPAGDLTTELTITLSGGAQDNVGGFAHKLVSSTRADKYAMTLDSFWMDTNYSTTGSAKTATVEIISSASLNADDISLVLEYLGTASSSLATVSTTLPSSLAAASAVTTSTATWNSSPATPVKQKLQATFTPRTAGRVRALVRLGKASATVYINPQVTIT